jgi:hypothetical protein
MNDARVWLGQLQKYEPSAYAEMNRLIGEAAAKNKSVKEMTIEEIRRLKGAVASMWAEGERDKSIVVEGKRVAVEQAVAEITEQGAKLVKKGPLPGQNKAVTRWESFIAFFQGIRSSMRRVESLLDSFDGNQPGPFTKYFWRPIHKAIGQYRNSRDEAYKQYVKILKDLQPHLSEEPIDATDYIDYVWKNTQELVAAMLHTGNMSNKAKMLLGGRPGNPWAVYDEETGAIDDSRWQQMIRDYVARGILKKEHFDAVQAIWDLTEEMKPDIQRVYRIKFGTFFDEVPAEAFTVTFPDGSQAAYRGGYVPARVDRDLVYDVFDPAKSAEVDQEFKDSMPTTGWGFTIKRMDGYNKPLDFDLSRIPQHIEHVQRFVHLQPVLWDMSRLLRDENIKSMFNAIDPTIMPNTIIPWLEKVASQRTGKTSGMPALDPWIRMVRNRAGMAIVFAEPEQRGTAIYWPAVGSNEGQGELLARGVEAHRGR